MCAGWLFPLKGCGFGSLYLGTGCFIPFFANEDSCLGASQEVDTIAAAWSRCLRQISKRTESAGASCGFPLSFPERIPFQLPFAGPLPLVQDGFHLQTTPKKIKMSCSFWFPSKTNPKRATRFPIGKRAASCSQRFPLVQAVLQYVSDSCGYPPTSANSAPRAFPPRARTRPASSRSGLWPCGHRQCPSRPRSGTARSFLFVSSFLRGREVNGYKVSGLVLLFWCCICPCRFVTYADTVFCLSLPVQNLIFMLGVCVCVLCCVCVSI